MLSATWALCTAAGHGVRHGCCTPRVGMDDETRNLPSAAVPNLTNAQICRRWASAGTRAADHKDSARKGNEQAASRECRDGRAHRPRGRLAGGIYGSSWEGSTRRGRMEVARRYFVEMVWCAVRRPGLLAGRRDGTSAAGRLSCAEGYGSSARDIVRNGFGGRLDVHTGSCQDARRMSLSGPGTGYANGAGEQGRKEAGEGRQEAEVD
ncbi:hypothetical protein C8Q77DRAFT_1135087 [Trametes polyzona]|nr:hypothetical protein C8Q77DRAFT_1135087 [Trametes polyzona]